MFYKGCSEAFDFTGDKTIGVLWGDIKNDDITMYKTYHVQK